MALKAAHLFESHWGITPGNAVDLALAVVNIYWSEPQEPALMEMEKCFKLFFVAMMAKVSLFSLN